jgi:hypothetical protein
VPKAALFEIVPSGGELLAVVAELEERFHEGR